MLNAGAASLVSVMILVGFMVVVSFSFLPEDEHPPLTWLDLKDGPVVVESPPNVLGIVDNFWFRYVADLTKISKSGLYGAKTIMGPDNRGGYCRCSSRHTDFATGSTTGVPWRGKRVA